MSDKPIQWEIVASMDAVQTEHPDWTEEQCREEFNRLADAGLKAMLDEQEAKRNKRKRKTVSDHQPKGTETKGGKMTLLWIAISFAAFIAWIGISTKLFSIFVKWNATKYMMAACGWVFGSILILAISIAMCNGWRP